MKGCFSRLRVLPMLIGAASLLLVVKLGDVFTGIHDQVRPAFAVATAHAGETRPGATVPQTPAAATASAPSEGSPSAMMTAAPAADDRASGQNGGLSAAEIGVLQQLTERRQALDQREGELAGRLALLQAAEHRIDQKIQDLRDLRATLEQLTKIRDEQEETKILSLVKIYENMRPKDAARIFHELEMDTLLLVVDRMRERKLAPIMAEMNPNKAMEITVELARLRQIPQLTLGSD